MPLERNFCINFYNYFFMVTRVLCKENLKQNPCYTKLRYNFAPFKMQIGTLKGVSVHPQDAHLHLKGISVHPKMCIYTLKGVSVHPQDAYFTP